MSALPVFDDDLEDIEFDTPDGHHYRIALKDVCSGVLALRPPNRVSVSKGAATILKIEQPGSAGGYWSPTKTPYMVEPMDALASRQHEAVIFVGPARTGKCLDLDTPLLTSDGWSTMGEIRVGDYVFNDTGAPTRVLAVHEVKHDLACYKVCFSDGESLITDSEHLWGVERFYWKTPNWRYEVRSTASMLEDFKYSKRSDGSDRCRYRVRNTVALDMPDTDLLVDPYLLGVWLGNGLTSSGKIASHKDDVPHYESSFIAAGHRVSSRLDRGNVFITAVDVLAPTDLHSKDAFIRRLRSLGVLGNKHIPSNYLRSSVSQRLALLQGLMDTDGYPGDGSQAGVEFSTVLECLKDGFCELARSLGFKPIAKLKKTSWTHLGEKRFGEAWRITFPVPSGQSVFRLPRKRDISVSASIDVGFRQIVDITPVASRPVRCIQVDAANSLFLAGRGLIPTHNTAGLLLGWMAHNVVNDPGDMLFIQMTKDAARAFSKTDVDRALRYSPLIAEMKSPRVVDSNTFDTMFRHGMWLRIVWPTVTNVSSSTYRYVAITDLDRMVNAENVDGEGPLFDLARKRTTTFMSRGMTLVESSPGIPMSDPGWVAATKHEAPPVTGILGLYNRTDRKRWYWQCPDCVEWFEAKPGLSLFNLPPDENLMEEIRAMDIDAMARKYSSRIICPCCAVEISAKLKNSLNLGGKWLSENQWIDAEGIVQGDVFKSNMVGYWIGGVAAGYQSWKSLVERYLQGLRDYALTGSEETLKNTITGDQGLPYTPRYLIEAQHKQGRPQDRGKVDHPRYIVPDWTRSVVVAVDVQGGMGARFEVQVHAVGEHMEQHLVDRFNLKWSKREGMGGDFAPIDPAGYSEDWDVITEKVLMATWRTPTEGLEIKAKLCVIDTGGEGKNNGGEGVTLNAYAWYRRVRILGMAHQVMLYKGASVPSAPIVKQSMVGKRNPEDKPDVPLYVCNPHLLSDGVFNGLRRNSPGPGFYHFPMARHPNLNPDGWLPAAFFDELQAEVRDPVSGTWSKIRKRNESFDLCRMIYAGMLRLGMDKVKNWETIGNTVLWLAPLDRNSLIIHRKDRQDMKENIPLPMPEPKPAIIAQPRVRRSSVAAL